MALLPPSTFAVVNATLIQDCKALRLRLALSVNPQPYYYDVGYTTINMQNITKTQFEEVNKLMATVALDVSYNNFTAQQIYDHEVAENIQWRELSKKFTQDLANNSELFDSSNSIPLSTKITNMTALHSRLYGYWRQIYMIAFKKRQRQYSFTLTPLNRIFILSTSNTLNATTRTKILNSRIAILGKDIGLLRVLSETLKFGNETALVQDYISVLQNDMDVLEQYKVNFNSTFYDSDPILVFRAKMEPVRSLLNWWEYRMFVLVSQKKNIVNDVQNAVDTLNAQ